MLGASGPHTGCRRVIMVGPTDQEANHDSTRGPTGVRAGSSAATRRASERRPGGTRRGSHLPDAGSGPPHPTGPGGDDG